MSYIEQIQDAIDFVESHLNEDIDITLVARAAGISRWHFQRIFKALTNETVKTYIRSRRLARSLEQLLTTDQRILEIAMAAGYESQASFTRTFKQTFGLTPAAYRRLGDRGLFLKKIRIDSEYLSHIHENVSLEPRIERRPEMRIIGLRTILYGIDSEKNNMASRLPPLWDAFLGRVGEIEQRIATPAYGVIRQLSDNDEELEYLACVEVNETQEVPFGMVDSEVPLATYATFAHRGKSELLDNTVNYVYSNWLLRSRHRHSSGPDLEIYGSEYEPDSPLSVIGYAIPLAEL